MTTTDEQKQEKVKKSDDWAEVCAGCGCLLLSLWVVFAVVSWGWHIHWLFGLLLLIFILGIK